MYAKARLTLILFLLPLTGCVLGAGEALIFPTYQEGETSFPLKVEVPPLFSGNGNYGLVASGDTLYHMELRHGRIHGKTPVNGEITAIAAGSGSNSFLTHGDTLVLLSGFDIAATCQLSGTGLAMTVCGTDPVILLDDGTLQLYSGADLSLIGSFTPEDPSVTCIQGFPGIVTIGYQNGTMLSLSIPSFSETASEKANGSLLFLAGAGEKLIFACDAWNEVAVCLPQDLIIQEMFTFSETPVSASSDPEISCVYAVCPSSGLQVCLANGEIAWRTDEFGRDIFVVLSDDREKALVTEGNTVYLLLR
ncbi:MAG: hypothetical protein KAH54_02440 [Candidatus Sabulitectum sp.]|nr:hypothetical protein [Candidatus Sabulitectum sp.]